MKTRIISLDHVNPALGHGARIPAPEQAAPANQSTIIDLDKPSTATSPRGRAGWLSILDATRRGQRPSRFAVNIPNSSANHGFSSSDISNGLRIYIDQSEVTLNTSGSYTTNADVLQQLATDISTVSDVRAQWEANGSRFQIEKTNNRPLNLAVGTSGANNTQNQGLMSLLTHGTANRHHTRLRGEWVDTGRIQLESGWSENAVVINGVPIKHYYTDTFQGRIEAINEVSELTGVTATGLPAQLEATIAFGETEGASNFSYKSMSVNGVGITLREFEAGESVADVVTEVVKKLGYHTRNQGPLNYLDIYSEGSTVHLNAQDLEHGIVIDGGTNADLYLVTKMGGRRFDGPSIRLEQEGDDEILVSIPSDPTSYTAENQIKDQRPGPDILKSRENLRQLLTRSPDTARLYFSHGLLAGETQVHHAGQARRILHGEETLARSRGNTFNFKSTQALESFRNRAAANLARQGYRIGEDTKSPAAASNFGLDRAERKSEVLPLYQKVEDMADMRTLRTEVSGKTRGNLFDQYSLSGITRKFTKG